MLKKISIISLLSISALTMSGCSLSDMTVEGGTRIPENPEHHLNVGLSTVTELTDLFGEPQKIESFEWGQVVTYQYWSKQIGSNDRYEEYVDFKFNENGFLVSINNYTNDGAIETAINVNKDEQCPPNMKVCQYYKPLKR